MHKQNIMLLANDTAYTYNLRSEVISRLIEEGHIVTVACRFMKLKDELESLGCHLININTRRRGTNPFSDFMLFLSYVKLLCKEKPDMVFSYNIKPNIYGGMACRLLRIRYMPNITGLGTAVETPGRMQSLTTRLYKAGFSRAECVFFQNSENECFFHERKLLSKHTRTKLLPGSGVNLDRFRVMPYLRGKMYNFLFAARIMKEKGIDLYLNAAKSIHNRYGNTIFHICGSCEEDRYAEVLRCAENEGYVRYHGEAKDMSSYLGISHCLIHPSLYPEGISNVLLEAAASARPIITTNRPGCREAVEDGVSGYIVQEGNVDDLIQKIEMFMALSFEEQQMMGLAGRRKAEREFDRRIVIQAYLDEL